MLKPPTSLGIAKCLVIIWDYPGGGALGFEHGGLGAQRKGEIGEVVASEGTVPFAVTLGGCIPVINGHFRNQLIGGIYHI